MAVPSIITNRWRYLTSEAEWDDFNSEELFCVVQLQQLLSEWPEMVLIDVRPKEQFQIAHMPGASTSSLVSKFCLSFSQGTLLRLE